MKHLHPNLAKIGTWEYLETTWLWSPRIGWNTHLSVLADSVQDRLEVPVVLDVLRDVTLQLPEPEGEDKHGTSVSDN